MIDPREQFDLLISRIADGEATDLDWSEFSRLADAHPSASAWKQLAQAQREHASMSLAVGVALHAADRVDLPSPSAAAAFVRPVGPQQSARPLWRLGVYGGWAAAAAFALAWVGGFGSSGGPLAGRTGTQQAGLVPAGWKIDTPDDAVRAYLDVGAKQGRVIGELPNRVPVYSQPAVLDSGQQGVRVFYVRQFIESAVVTDLARIGLDESGRPVPVPASMPAAASWPAQ
ncbi:MAG: hypothetical protein ACK4WH_09280 [Phycisphaerales bacterium]